jgi:hypothetical protein
LILFVEVCIGDLKYTYVVILLQHNALSQNIQRYLRRYRLDSVKYPEIALMRTETSNWLRDKSNV